MTAPVPAKTSTGPTVTGGSGRGGFASAAPTPPDHRTTALESAVSVLRGGKPAATTKDVLAMAEEFYQFLKKGNRD